MNAVLPLRLEGEPLARPFGFSVINSSPLKLSQPIKKAAEITAASGE